VVASGCCCASCSGDRSSRCMIKIELNQEQANSLLQLIDIAVKAGGIANAKAALPLVDIIVNAAQAKPE